MFYNKLVDFHSLIYIEFLDLIYKIYQSFLPITLLLQILWVIVPPVTPMSPSMVFCAPLSARNCRARNCRLAQLSARNCPAR